MLLLIRKIYISITFKSYKKEENLNIFYLLQINISNIQLTFITSISQKNLKQI